MGGLGGFAPKPAAHQGYWKEATVLQRTWLLSDTNEDFKHIRSIKCSAKNSPKYRCFGLKVAGISVIKLFRSKLI